MKYWQRKKQERLYRQWAKHSELPPEAIPTFDEPKQTRVAEDTGVPEDAGGSDYIRASRDYSTVQDAGLEVGHNGRYLLENRGLWYRFRVLLVDVVRKILRVD
jgi:hypothetical protein